MDGKKKEFISLFTALGESLKGFGGDSGSQKVIGSAITENPWFTPEGIMFAVNSLRDYMLQEDILHKWLSPYSISYSSPKRIGIIMAGNIPLVGFHDIMCSIACGNECHIKPSSRDSVLMDYFVSLMRQIMPGLPVYQYSSDARYDAVIATGSNSTNSYFRSHFSGTPSLLRGSRYSAAMLTGNESYDELRGLSNDIFLYNGMGCRNVSLVFIPAGYDISEFGRIIAPKRINPKFVNNYRQNKAQLSLQGKSFTDAGNFLMTESRDFPNIVSQINYTYYTDRQEVRGWLEEHEDELQIAVSSVPVFPRMAGFGQAQLPRPWDYADGRDVVEFLISLK